VRWVELKYAVHGTHNLGSVDYLATNENVYFISAVTVTRWRFFNSLYMMAVNIGCLWSIGTFAAVIRTVLNAILQWSGLEVGWCGMVYWHFFIVLETIPPLRLINTIPVCRMANVGQMIANAKRYFRLSFPCLGQILYNMTVCMRTSGHVFEWLTMT